MAKWYWFCETGTVELRKNETCEPGSDVAILFSDAIRDSLNLVESPEA
ncbi:MAG: hypothetical protein Q4C47_00550 [Planctomycetia bacterium]|nr:hypothetical protein [Planctomycetia bacterium]